MNKHVAAIYMYFLHEKVQHVKPLILHENVYRGLYNILNYKSTFCVEITINPLHVKAYTV